MSLWGEKEYIILSLLLNITILNLNKNLDFKLMTKFIGLLDGDGYIEIGPQKQSENENSKSTIRIRIVLRLHKDDKELLNYFINTLNIGKLNELKDKNQFRLIIYKTDI